MPSLIPPYIFSLPLPFLGLFFLFMLSYESLYGLPLHLFTNDRLQRYHLIVVWVLGFNRNNVDFILTLILLYIVVGSRPEARVAEWDISHIQICDVFWVQTQSIQCTVITLATHHLLLAAMAKAYWLHHQIFIWGYKRPASMSDGHEASWISSTAMLPPIGMQEKKRQVYSVSETTGDQTNGLQTICECWQWTAPVTWRLVSAFPVWFKPTSSWTFKTRLLKWILW